MSPLPLPLPDPPQPSLSDVNASVRLGGHTGGWQRLMAFIGPGYLVAVGYMDPGNWATDIAGGSAFGYQLLSVILLSNLMAMLLQALSLRLGVVTGLDLAQACRQYYSRPVALALWALCELAIIACDLAEVIGTAIALKLLFDIPLPLGVLLSAFSIIVLLMLQKRGFRWLEAFVMSLMGIVALCFAYQVFLAAPDASEVARGFIPTTSLVTDPAKLYLAIGILGATVMPHNLYLHSSIVQTRAYARTDDGVKEALRFGTIDSTIALLFALFINAAILIVAAATLHTSGHTTVAGIEQAHNLLAPLLGSALAATLFGIALLAAGINSTLTATLAGQIVMEGFLRLKLPLWKRQLITRLLAIIPAAFVAIAYGERGTGQLLVLSQVILCLQLPFAVIPLVSFTGSSAKMGSFATTRWLKGSAVVVATLIVTVNLHLLWGLFTGL